MATNLSVKVILGTTRESRFGDKPAHWILGEAGKLPGVVPELLDLRDFALPFYDRATPSACEGGVYTHPAVKRWAERVLDGDAYIVVSPEYNHGYSAVLKNALDHIYPEWGRKPIGFVSYGNAGGARAIEQLRQVAIELQMWPIKAALHIPVEIYLAAMNEPIPPNPAVFEPMRNVFGANRVAQFFDDLLWSARALKSARTASMGRQARG